MPMNRKLLFELAKGARGRSKNCISIARRRVEKGLQYAYSHRRERRRDLRMLWITRVNAACRLYGVKYSDFAHALVKTDIKLDRKILAELAVTEPYSFKSIVQYCKKYITSPPKKQPITAVTPNAEVLVKQEKPRAQAKPSAASAQKTPQPPKRAAPTAEVQASGRSLNDLD